MPLEEAMERKFGSRGKALMERVKASGADVGAAFAGEAPARSFDSRCSGD